MKSWFPFTDYDFYAYITSGVIAIASVDYTIFGGILVNRTEWTVVQGVFWTMLSYLVGHITAGLSSFVLEQTITKRVFRSPSLILLGLTSPRWFEKLFSSLFAREYAPLPKPSREEIIQKLCSKLQCNQANLTDAETMFHTAFSVARYEASSELRLNQFMNLYGLCRNVAFAFVLASILLIWKFNSHPAPADGWLTAAAVIMAVGMYGRFLKFYSAYTRETFRAFGRKD